MCVVSVVQDYFKNQPPSIWNQSTFDEYKEIIRRLGELDKKLDQKDCEDPAKAAWMKEVEERLKTLESRS